MLGVTASQSNAHLNETLKLKSQRVLLRLDPQDEALLHNPNGGAGNLSFIFLPRLSPSVNEDAVNALPASSTSCCLDLSARGYFLSLFTSLRE